MNVASPAPGELALTAIRPAMRDVATSGIVEVFNYGRARQGLIPLLGRRGRPAHTAVHQRSGQGFSRSRRDVLHRPARRPELRAAIAAYMTQDYGARPAAALSRPRTSSSHRRHARDRDRDKAHRRPRGRGADPVARLAQFCRGAGNLRRASRARPARQGGALEPRSGKARSCGDPRDAPHISQLPRQPDRLHRDARGDRRDAGDRPPARLVDHRRRNLRAHHLRWGPRALVPRRHGARR